MAKIIQNKRKVVVDGILSGHGWSNLDGEGLRLKLTVGDFTEPKQCRIELTREEASSIVSVLTSLLRETAALP